VVGGGSAHGRRIEKPVARESIRRYGIFHDHALEQHPVVVGLLTSGLANACA
jgi:hypothetical protein